MKDKLVKTGHNKLYYRFRAVGIFALSFVAFSLVVTAPILIARQAAENRIAEEESKVVSSEETSTSEEEITSYFEE